MTTILHLLPAAEWQRLADAEPVGSPSLGREGFIHCTDSADVLLQIANAFYVAQPDDFVVLHVDVDQLSSRCVWEAPVHVDGSSGPGFAPSFPHVYGPIDRVAVAAVQALRRDAVGRFTGYGELVAVS